MTSDDLAVWRNEDGQPVISSAPADVLMSVELLGALDTSDWATYDRGTNVVTFHAINGTVRYKVARFANDFLVETHRLA